ncbi:coiled-coil domain-containing protein 180-like [Arapaima gigas]
MGENRVVPGGKVSRQIPAAQVQLCQALRESRRKREERLRDGDARCSSSSLFPQLRTPSSQPSTRAQLSSESKPKPKSEDQAVKEIHMLPDLVVSEKTGSGIIERLKEKQRTKHTEAVADLQRSLATLSLEFEKLIKQTADDFLGKMSQCDDNMERQMQRMENISDLKMFVLEDVQRLWGSVSEESAKKKKWIKELDKVLNQYESQRIAMIALLLKKHKGILETINYEKPSDIQQLVHTEAMMVNQTVLLNRHAVTELVVNLTEKDLQKQQLHRLHWEGQLQEWRKLKVTATVEKFREFMDKLPSQHLSRVEETLKSLRATQESLSEECRAALQVLSSITPPTCSKTLVAQWYDSLATVGRKIDHWHVDSLSQLRLHYERTWQDCLAEVEKFEGEVGPLGLPPDEIRDVVTREFLRPVGLYQKRVEEQLGEMDRTLETLAKQAGQINKSLLKFARGATHLWEHHFAELRRKEQHLQVQLDEVYRSHQEEIQKKEAQLDVMMDRLRQENLEETLRATLDKILQSLGEVRDRYIGGYSEAMETVEKYPATVLEELFSYSSAVSQFFGVRETYRMVQIPALSDTFWPAHVPLPVCPFSQVEEFTTAKGNVYHGRSFKEQWLDYGDVGLSGPETTQVAFPTHLLAELQREVRLGFFNHLEEWCRQAVNNAVSIVEAEKEKLRSKRDLWLRLHEPRAKRVEMDIHNVRAGEALHHHHVNRHCNGVLSTLSEFRADFQELRTQQFALAEDFRAQMSNLEAVVSLTSKSDTLVTLCRRLQSQLEKHTGLIQTLQRNFRQSLELKLEGLRQSSIQLIQSFRLFLDGGNFSPREAELHQRRLEKIVKHIDSADEALMSDVDGVEFECLQQAKDVVQKVEDRCHFVVGSLKFLEKMRGVFMSTQVQVKSEVAKSNMQNTKLCEMLAELERMIETFTEHSPDMKTAARDHFISFSWSIFEELKQRCQYLECSVDPYMVVSLPVPAHPKSCEVDQPSNSVTPSVLQPSHTGLTPPNDVAVGVIQELLRFSRPQIREEVHSSTGGRDSTQRTVFRQRDRAEGAPSPSAPETVRGESVSSTSKKRFSKATRFQKRFQVFGCRPEEEAKTSFKGSVVKILWKANDVLLSLAEEFYKKKERRHVSRPQAVQETFELCAEEMNLKLLQYYNQAQEHYSSSLQEFCALLGDFERGMAKMVVLLINQLGEEHLDVLNKGIEHFCQHLKFSHQTFESKKSRELRSWLGHPAYEEELQALSAAEEERQREQAKFIQCAQLDLQACMSKRGDEFVAALASLTEDLLHLLDGLPVADETQAGQAEPKKNVTTLIRQKQGGLPVEKKPSSTQGQRSSRTWPGLRHLNVGTLGRSYEETPSMRATKTTLGHEKAVEARDTVYQHYEQRWRKELAAAQQQLDTQRKEAVCWEQHWQRSLQILHQLRRL